MEGRDRDSVLAERIHDTVLTLNGVSSRKQFSRWFLAQYKILALNHECYKIVKQQSPTLKLNKVSWI